MRMRHLALTTALAGLLAGGAAYGPAVQAQTNRPDTPAAENRQIENPAGPATIPSPIDDNAVLPGRGDSVTTSEAAENETSSPSESALEETAPVTTSADARELIGAPLKSADDETVGEVESVYLDPQGGVRSVIVGVGGFFGFGERKVALGWNALNVADDGRTVHTTLTKDQMKAMPEYRYADTSHRGRVFNDSGVVTN